MFYIKYMIYVVIVSFNPTIDFAIRLYDKELSEGLYKIFDTFESFDLDPFITSLIHTHIVGVH
jgi:hypothetical protein